MKDSYTIHQDRENPDRSMVEPCLDQAQRLEDEPRLYPQRKRAWDKLMADIEQASSTLRISRASLRDHKTPH